MWRRQELYSIPGAWWLCHLYPVQILKQTETTEKPTSINPNSIPLLFIKRARKNKKYVHCPWISKEKVHHFPIYYECATLSNKTKRKYTKKSFMPAVLKVEKSIFQNYLWLISVISLTCPEISAFLQLTEPL